MENLSRRDALAEKESSAARLRMRARKWILPKRQFAKRIDHRARIAHK